jgi:hypothetical protein
MFSMSRDILFQLDCQIHASQINLFLGQDIDIILFTELLILYLEYISNTNVVC